MESKEKHYIAVIRWSSRIAGGEVTREFPARGDAIARQEAASIFREGVCCEVLKLWEVAREVPLKEPVDMGLDLFLKSDPATFKLSVRANNGLKNARVNTGRGLAKKTPAELLKIKHLGRTTLRELENLLVSRGLWLGMSDEKINELLDSGLYY